MLPMSPGRTTETVVAGDRSGRYHLKGEPDIIEIGRWQIALKRTLSKIFPPVSPPSPANQAQPPQNAGRLVADGFKQYQIDSEI